MVREFIEGWDLMQTLGEGAFAEVKLLVNRETGEACAMKEIPIKDKPELKELMRKEICVHKLLKHPHVVQCYGSRVEDDRQFIFLEYCSGGELFDRIEPEIGMPEHQAQYYFRQLMDGLEYLHHRGVAHRDIKPENLLLTDNDVLKISDFGMATVFRHQGKERKLERKCGTRPYIAPEILSRPKYCAQPADIWSCGIVLVAMLSGELPWDEPTTAERQYVRWKYMNVPCTSGPWRRISTLPLSLLKKILAPSPCKRYTVAQVMNHMWFKKKFRDQDLLVSLQELDENPNKRFRDEDDGFPGLPTENQMHEANEMLPRLSASQPPLSTIAKKTSSASGSTVESSILDKDLFGGFSQPAQLSDLFCSTQSSQGSQATQSSKGSQFQRLVKRMTRFWVNTSLTETEDFLILVIERLNYIVKSRNQGILTVETTDRRGATLVFRSTLIQVDNKILVDFRLSRGCGLEFKKHFAKIKADCDGIIESGPIMWPTLIPSNSLPASEKDEGTPNKR